MGLKKIALGSHSHSVGFPLLIVFVEIETRRRVETQFVVRSENDGFRQGKKIFDRGETSDFSGIQFPKAKDQRRMIGCLFIIEKVSIEMTFGGTVRREDRPSVDLLTTERIEVINEKIREIDVQWMKFDVNRRHFFQFDLMILK